jgi:hypothetical protein
MKRSGIKRKTAMRSKRTFDTKRDKVATKRMKSGPRKLTALELCWQHAVLSLETCSQCGHYGVQWAHRNEGKGMGCKMPPDQTAALCIRCHTMCDQYIGITRDQSRAFMDVAIFKTHQRLRALNIYPGENHGKPI